MRALVCAPARYALGLILLVTMALAAGPVRADEALRRGSVATLLARFEQGTEMPPLIAGLPLETRRAYAILVQLVPPYRADLADPNSVRRGLLSGLNPLAVSRAGTRLGHAMIGWRCTDGAFGLTGKTSDDPDLGVGMMRQGWGMAAVMSDFRYGRLHGRDDIDPGHLRALSREGVRIVAFEIAPAACQRMRGALAAYIAHPNRPELSYSNLQDPERMRGDGCASFALWLAGQGGLFAGFEPLFWREIVLRDSFVGQGDSVPEGVVPARFGPAGQTVSLRQVMLGDWTRGQEIGRVRSVDPELLTLALDRAYRRAGIARPRRLPAGDARREEIVHRVDRWLGRYGRATPVRMGPARAVVLHLR